MYEPEVALFILALLLLPFVLALVLTISIVRYLGAKRRYYDILMYAEQKKLRDAQE